jgi:hypothetical protein
MLEIRSVFSLCLTKLVLSILLTRPLKPPLSAFGQPQDIILHLFIVFRHTRVSSYGSYSAGRISLETRSEPVGVEYLCEACLWDYASPSAILCAFTPLRSWSGSELGLLSTKLLKHLKFTALVRLVLTLRSAEFEQVRYI